MTRLALAMLGGQTKRRLWYVIDPYRRKGSCRARYPFRWLALAHCMLNVRLDYGRAADLRYWRTPCK